MFARRKTLGDHLKELFGGRNNNAALFDDMEDALLEADIGSKLALELGDQLRELVAENKGATETELRLALAGRMAAMLKKASMEPDTRGTSCFLFLGVNGVGKTTTLAKFAYYLKQKRPDCRMVLAAGDTFRAAACEQLVLHGTRLGIRSVSQGQGADSGAVIFDALQSAEAKGENVVLADTAGRLHNKANLVKELEKVDRIVKARIDPVRYKKILVLDATTGRNGVQQAEVFNEAVGVDAVVLSKYDSSAKGGMVLSICKELGLGVAFVGTGEAHGDLVPFDPEVFARNMVGL